MPNVIAKTSTASSFHKNRLAWLRGFGVGFAGLFLTSCAVGPNFVVPPAPAVTRYTSEPLSSPQANSDGSRVGQQHFVNGADISTRWWVAFRSLPLNELVRLSVEHNPSLQAAEAAIKLAQFNALAQRGLFFPQIGANYAPSDPADFRSLTVGSGRLSHRRCSLSRPRN